MNRLRSALTALAIAFLGTYTVAQSSDIEALTGLVGEEKIAYMQENHPDRLPYMAFLNRQGYYLSESTGEKDLSQYPNALDTEKVYTNAEELSLTLIQNGELDLLGYKFSIDEEKFNYYRIGNTGKVLTILPEKMIREKFNAETD